MTYYKIDNLGYSLSMVADAKELFKVRKQNLKATSILWICYESEIDPTYIDATYEKKFPVLIFLN